MTEIDDILKDIQQAAENLSIRTHEASDRKLLELLSRLAWYVQTLDPTPTPILPGRIDHKTGSVKVWCCYCQKDHTHGHHSPSQHPECPYPKKLCICPPGTGDGYRHAHCHDEHSPYVEGYVIRETRPEDL